MKTEKKNIILTSSSGYKFHHLQPFLKTLFATTYKGEVVFFISDTDEKTIEQLKKYPIKLIPFTYKYPYILNSLEITNNVPLNINFTPHPKTIRYIMYLAYLKTYEGLYNNIMLTDVRDVIFQKDPFEFKIENSVYTFLEDKSQKIKDNFYNSLWIKEAFGQDALNELGDNSIICSGISIGKYSNIRNYLEKLTEYIIHVVKDRGCKDQGIHNYIIHTNQVKNVKLIADDEGPVSTISTHKPNNRVRLNKSKIVIGIDRDVINIVHQYDRHWKLLWKYNKRDYLKKRTDLLKQFILAVIKAGKIKKSHLVNLRSIIFSPMMKKYNWD